MAIFLHYPIKRYLKHFLLYITVDITSEKKMNEETISENFHLRDKTAWWWNITVMLILLCFTSENYAQKSELRENKLEWCAEVIGNTLKQMAEISQITFLAPKYCTMFLCSNWLRSKISWNDVMIDIESG